MAVPGIKLAMTGLSKCLVDLGLLTEAAAQQYREEAAKKKTGFVTHLVNSNVLDSQTIAKAASHRFGIPLFDLGALDIDLVSIKLVSEKLIRQHHVLPVLKRGKKLFIAASDPTNLQALEDIQFHTGLHVEAILVEDDKLTKTIEKALDAADTTIKELLDEDLENLEIRVGDDNKDNADVDSEIDDAPVVRFVNKILLDAIHKGASDIHFEPYERFFRVRFRHDGILHEVVNPPISLAARINARIKVMARLNIAERRVPQDGRIKMALSKNRSIDFRVNSCPTLFGEKIVLRILDPTSAQIGLDRLGFEEDQKQHFLKAINKPYGMILVTGPTGSGKTVSLYTGLNILNSTDRNISTAEDPVEITVAGINQVSVNPKTGLTFAEALRAFPRQDPDVIMVGEIRDLETAEIAVKAAQTGHLVLSTVHTNDAPQTLNRLAQMGVPPYNIASSVILIMAQRLARRLCEHCKQEERLPSEALLDAGFSESDLHSMTLYGPAGCENCVKGYKGRVAIFQVMPVTDRIGDIIMEGGNALQLRHQAKTEGGADLRESGLNKVKAGVTSLQEIERVTRE